MTYTKNKKAITPEGFNRIAKSIGKVSNRKSAQSSMKDWDKYTEIEEALGSEEFLMATMKGLSSDQMNEALYYINRMYDINFGLGEGSNSMDRNWDLYDSIVEALGPEETLMNVYKGLSAEEMKDMIDFIYTTYEIAPEEEEESDEPSPYRNDPLTGRNPGYEPDKYGKAAEKIKRAVRKSAQLDINEVLNGYMEALMWASTPMEGDVDEDGEPMENFDSFSFLDIDEDSKRKMKQIVTTFFNVIGEDKIQQAMQETGNDEGQLGHDIALTTNGHGAGFWDGDWANYGEEFTEVCRDMGGVDLYLGGDGKLYI
jgi:hypothetical protein